MQKNSVAAALRSLATGDKARSETARLKDVIDEIEAALSAGVSRAAIVDALHEQGFTMTLKSFESALYRIRKKRREQKGRPSESVTHITEPEVPKGEGQEIGMHTTKQDEPAEGGLSPRERREKLADQYIKPETSNPLLKRLKNTDK